MIVSGKIIDKSTAEPIPFATVQLINNFGNYLGVGASSNDKGNFSIASSLIAAPNSLLFTSAGGNYMPLAVEAAILSGQPVQIALETKPDLDNITITFKPKASFWWLLLIPILFMTKKTKR
jgi:hypothetical protein